VLGSTIRGGLVGTFGLVRGRVSVRVRCAPSVALLRVITSQVKSRYNTNS
jgi:hypothetical protein